MRGNFQFDKNNYPFRLDGAVDPDTGNTIYFIRDQRNQETVSTHTNADEAVEEHGKLRDTYYQSHDGIAELDAQEQQVVADGNRSRLVKEKAGD